MDSIERQEVRRTLNTLLRVAREVGEPLPLDELLGRIELATRQTLECERVTVFLIDRDRDELYSRFATGPDEIRIPANSGIAGRTFSEERVINVPDVLTDPGFYSEIDRRTGFRTRNLLSVPLMGFDGSVIGVLEIVNKRGGVFGPADVEMASALASLTGIALQRQLLLDEHTESLRREDEFRRAREIQRSLLPSADPCLEGFDIAGWSKPVHEAGGDFYDYLTLPDGRMCVIVADVAGHGLESALVACEARALVRALATETSDLEVIMRRTNQILCTDLRYERFVIMFVGALDIGTSELQYIGAGCPTLAYRHAADTSHLLPATAPPLAVGHALPHPLVGQTTLKEGDILALVTDGFYEWSPAAEHPLDNPEPFGFERIFDVMRTNRTSTAVELIRSLHDTAAEFAGAPQTDDLTAVVVRKL